MSETGPGEDGQAEDARIRSLQQRIERAEQVETVRTKKAQAHGDDSYRLGNRVLAELIGGLAGGALIGWILDRLLGTSPWLLLALLFLGTVAAFRNIIRISTKRPDQ